MSEPDRSQLSDGYHTFEELYQHRHALFLNLLRVHREDAWACRTHEDGSMYEGWFVAGLETPCGQVSYHLPMALWALVEDMGIARDEPVKWDGHSASDVALRLTEWAMLQPSSETPAEGAADAQA